MGSAETLPDLPVLPPPTDSSLATLRNTAMDRAIAQLGVRYRYGGVAPETGFDCSGFVRYLISDLLTRPLPRSAAEIAKVDAPKVDDQDLAVGDLIFFKINYRAISHVAMYVGDRQFIHAPRTGGGIRVESIDQPYWQHRMAYAKRFIGNW
jgi:cell wall-associated NlpC family hydrolase